MSSDIFFFFNGNIITVDENYSIYDSLAFLEENILFVGKREEIEVKLREQYPDHRVKEVDLAGKTVVPGFIDSHMHPIMGIYFKTQLQLTHVKTYNDLKLAFDEMIATKKEDEWILGLDFLEERFIDPSERRFPTKEDLDKISKTHPIVIIRHDGHSCFANSRAMEVIGLTKETLFNFKTELGKIELDEYGEPNGIFTEAATSFIIDQIQAPSFDTFTRAGLKFSREMASFGITTLGAIIQTTEEGPSGKTGSFEFPIMQLLIQEKVLTQDYVFYMITAKPNQLSRYAKKIKKLDYGRNQFVMGGIKRFFDGSIGSRTAYLNSPFSDGVPNNYGFLVHNQNELFNQLKLTYELGFDMICHAIGDKAIQILVDSFKKIREKAEFINKKIIMRIEHASILTKQLLDDINENHIMISSQPAFLESEHFWLKSRLGEERCNLIYPFKSIIEKGIVLAGASDAPVENPNVLNAIGITMHRFGFIPHETLTIQQALRMFTINAATAMGQRHCKGSLEPSKYADFVILDKNILNMKAEEIKKIEVLATYRRGTRIFCKH